MGLAVPHGHDAIASQIKPAGDNSVPEGDRNTMGPSRGRHVLGSARARVVCEEANSSFGMTGLVLPVIGTSCRARAVRGVSWRARVVVRASCHTVGTGPPMTDVQARLKLETT